MSLIVGDRGDRHVVAVLAAAQSEIQVLDASSFAQRSVTITGHGLEVAGHPLPVSPGWIRRLAPDSWSNSVADGTLVGTERAASLSALAALLHDERIHWLTPVNRLGAAENKPFQYRRAQAAAVPVPEWFVTTDPARAPEDYGWVSKPLGSGFFTAEDGTGRIVPTTPFNPTTRAALAQAPFLLQRHVTAHIHARVVTVGDEAFSATLPALGLPTDWRLSADAHGGFTPDPVPDRVQALATRAAKAIGVGYSAQDWIRDTDGTWWFVDLNPSGQWLFLPDPVASQVTAAIAAFLDGQP